MAIVLRRGPADHVATIGWNRADNAFQMGQWLVGRGHEYRCDLSPDGRHMIYFACKGGGDCWSAISRAPFLRAVDLEKQVGTWGGGGAFTPSGAVWLNGRSRSLPHGDIEGEGLQGVTDPFALPYSPNAFFVANTYVAQLTARGWQYEGGEGYEAGLTRPLPRNGRLEQRFRLHVSDRALISSHYSTQFHGAWVDKPGWHWATVWGEHTHYADDGTLWMVAAADAASQTGVIVRDFTDMTFEPLLAPYDGEER